MWLAGKGRSTYEARVDLDLPGGRPGRLAEALYALTAARVVTQVLPSNQASSLPSRAS